MSARDQIQVAEDSRFKSVPWPRTLLEDRILQSNLLHHPLRAECIGLPWREFPDS